MYLIHYRICNYWCYKEILIPAQRDSGSACGGSNPPWGNELSPYRIRNYEIATGRTGAMLLNTMQKIMTNGLTGFVCGFCGGGKVMRRKFYMHRREGFFYACLVNRETGFPLSARSTGERDRDAALIVVSGWLRDGLLGKDGERRKAEAAFLDGILRGIRKAELDSGAALAIVKALKEYRAMLLP
jgi:hypothetical protein